MKFKMYIVSVTMDYQFLSASEQPVYEVNVFGTNEESAISAAWDALAESCGLDSSALASADFAIKGAYVPYTVYRIDRKVVDHGTV